MFVKISNTETIEAIAWNVHADANKPTFGVWVKRVDGVNKRVFTGSEKEAIEVFDALNYAASVGEYMLDLVPKGR